MAEQKVDTARRFIDLLRAKDAVLRDGTEYTNDNIAVLLFRDGLIANYHDYFDPRRFQVVVDALPGA